MLRLKKANAPEVQNKSGATEEKSLNIDDLYKNCFYCRWFDDVRHICMNDSIYGKLNNDFLYPFWENGNLAEAVKEGFNEQKELERELEQVLSESRIAKKRVDEIMELFREELENAILNWTESIDECVSTALINYKFLNGIPLSKPEYFHCKYFL
jgi:hypothetical protein